MIFVRAGSMPLFCQYATSWFSNDRGMMMYCSPVQPSNAEFSMVVRPSGKETEVSPVQPLNAPCSMVVRPSGKETEVSPVQPWNAP